MTHISKKILSLDLIATYKIKVPGELIESWINWDVDMIIEVEKNSGGLLITTLTADLDQAALHGLMRRLYSHGLPLMSVICVDFPD